MNVVINHTLRSQMKGEWNYTRPIEQQMSLNVVSANPPLLHHRGPRAEPTDRDTATQHSLPRNVHNQECLHIC